METQPQIQYIDRLTGQRCTETVMGDRALRFAYETALGRSLWGLLFGGPALSALLGRYYDSHFSRRAIPALATLPGCHADEAELPLADYASFNAFFTRTLKPGTRPYVANESVFLSPADGRLTVFPNCGATDPIPVKGAKRTLTELCGEPLADATYAVAVIRLAPVDYHRFHFPCTCTQATQPRIIRGTYHSVNPIGLARRPDLYVENTRHITMLNSPQFGDFYMIDVGAFGVGSIVQTALPGAHQRMDEKGYFKFGGSTVILALPQHSIVFDRDLIDASAAGYEVLVRCGMSIASTLNA